MKESDYLKDYSGPVVVDTGIFIEFYLKSDIGEYFRKYILENQRISKILIHHYTVTEIYYVLCRNYSSVKAIEFVDDILEICKVIPTAEIWREAGDCKCNYAVSISDSFSLAISRKIGVPVFFKSEAELVRVKERDEFDFQLILL